MLRVCVAAACLGAAACAPAPVTMSAGEASERLERFAAGASAMDVCTPDGRALLRGAVRAYGAEMARAGVAWPALPDDGGRGAPRNVDVAVVVAFAGGLVEASDFRGAMAPAALLNWANIADLRTAPGVACAQVLDLQRAAARVVAELNRYERLEARADPERLRRQRERLENARADVRRIAEAVEAEIARARRGG